MNNQAAGRPCGDECIDPARCDKTPSDCVLGVGRTYTMLVPTKMDGTIAEPLAALRWVHRDVHGGFKMPVLQQKWFVTDLSTNAMTHEWRDVPTETE